MLASTCIDPKGSLGNLCCQARNRIPTFPHLSNPVNVAAAKTTPIRQALTALPSQPRTIPLPLRPDSWTRRPEAAPELPPPEGHKPRSSPCTGETPRRAQLTLGLSSRRLSAAAVRGQPAASPGSPHSCLRLSPGVGSPSGEGVGSLAQIGADDYPGSEETKAEERPPPSTPSVRASLSCQLEAAAGSLIPFPARTSQL